MPDRKSLPAFFRHACTLGEVADPREAIAVCTNYHTTFLAAREVGMQAVLLDEHTLFPGAAEDGIVIREIASLRKLLLPDGGEAQLT
jgi:FMN phosphatase YigB (HAD superfamily)